MSMETPEITVCEDFETPQRASAITDAEANNNVILSTMEALLQGMSEMSKRLQQDDEKITARRERLVA